MALSLGPVLWASAPAHASSESPHVLALTATASQPVYPPRTPTCQQGDAIRSYGSSYSNVLTISGVAPHHPSQTISVRTRRGLDGVSGSTQSGTDGSYQFTFPIPAEHSNYPGHRNNKLFVYAAPHEYRKVYMVVSAFLCMTAHESAGVLTISYDGGGWDGGQFRLDSKGVNRTTDMSQTTTFSVPCPGPGTHSGAVRAEHRSVSVSFSIPSC